MAENDRQDAQPLPDGWVKATIGEMTSKDGVFSDGDWIESKDQDPNGDVRLVQLADIGDGAFRDRSDRYLTNEKALELGCTFLETGDLLIARMPHPLGRACIFPGDKKRCVTAVDVCIVRTANVDHRWLMHSVNSPQIRSEIAGYQSGSTRKRISRRNLAKIEFPLPPLPEQRRIVEAIETQLTRLDAAVAALERVQANLARYRASVLQAACEGRLVPTEAELARRAVGAQHAAPLPYEPADVLLERILAERRARWEEERWAYEIERAKKKAAQAERKAAGLPYYIRDLEPEHWQHRTPEEYEPYLPKSDKWKQKYDEPEPPDTEDLPELPEGWIWTTVEQITSSIQYGYTESAADDPIGPKFLRITDIQDGEVNWSTVPYCDCPADKGDKYRLKSGDIVFARTGATTGKSYLIHNPPEDAVFASYLIRLQPSKGIDPRFLDLFFGSPLYWPQIMTVRKGSAQPGVNATILSTLKVPLPPLAEQRRIVAEVERRLSVVRAMEAAVEANLVRAQRLRQSILKRAFEGRLVPQNPEDEPASVLLERIT